MDKDRPDSIDMSHPSRARGLKLFFSESGRENSRSHPSRVRGLKLGMSYLLRPFESHPSRVRGLKLLWVRVPYSPELSHPSRVRGLKPKTQTKTTDFGGVAPFTGAWIETCY